jgi:acyl carrier protein
MNCLFYHSAPLFFYTSYQKVFTKQFISNSILINDYNNCGEFILNAISKDIVQYLKTRGFLDGKETIAEDESLTETGVIDSIGLLQLVDHLESTYKIEIPMEIITPEHFDTLAGISKAVTNLKK